MKLIDGIFKYGNEVAIDVDGRLVKRKVHYADGELFVDIDGKRIKESDVSGKPVFDQIAYVTEYNRTKRDRITTSVPKEQGKKWREYASNLNMSMNAFIIYCVEKEING